MTVCVAAISKNGTIVGAADRMVTTLTEREPRRSKIFHFDTFPISLMYAGTIPFASAAIGAVAVEMQQYRPQTITVELLANSFANYCARAFGIMAERALLISIGTDRATLLAPDCSVPQQLRDDLLLKVQEYHPPETDLSVLVVGRDPDERPCLWRVVNTVADSCNLEGFAAIGTGADEAGLL